MEVSNLLDNLQLIIKLINKWLNITIKKSINRKILTIVVYKHIIKKCKENL
jgi:hypothetical protein